MAQGVESWKWQGYAACIHKYVRRDGGPSLWSGSTAHCQAVSQLGRARSRKQHNSNREITTPRFHVARVPCNAFLQLTAPQSENGQFR